MSQKKVDKYKKDKANRKKIIARQKRLSVLRTTIVSLVVVAFVGYFVASVLDKAGIISLSKSDEEETVYELSDKEVKEVWDEYKNGDTEDETADDASEDTTEAVAEDTTAEGDTVAEETTADNAAEDVASEDTTADNATETSEANVVDDVAVEINE